MDKLKYLFIAGFVDGSAFPQPENDTSTIDEKRSAFYDLLQRAEKSPIENFTLWQVEPDPDTGFRKIFSVHLKTGLFSINGIFFRMHDEELSGFKLIFFRKHQRRINQQVIADGKGGWAPGKAEELDHVITYRIGWEAHDGKGNKVQRIMEFE